MNDILFQKNFVVENAWRLKTLQDTNPASPSYGCFHYAYWRDKTSEFPDARFQEAAATLGLLAHPAFGVDESERADLLRRFHAGLLNLSRQQYREGCYDEWYKGERGFAATHFTTSAFGFAGYFLGDGLPAETRALLGRVMTRAGEWLLKRDDLVKTNHEAAATGALALIWKLTGDARFLAGAKTKLARTLAVQTDEGWFPELGGADLGYSTLILDYIATYIHLTGDKSPLPAMDRLVRFLQPHILPDMTLAPEAGLCANAYMGWLGFTLLCGELDSAAAVHAAAGQGGGVAGLKPFLADDLRLCRWSHLPLVTSLIDVTPRAVAAGSFYPAGVTYHPRAALLSYHNGNVHAYAALANGGDVRYAAPGRGIVHYPLPLLAGGGTLYSASGYNNHRPIEVTDNAVTVEAAYAVPRFFFPGFLQRLILRAGSTTALGSRFLRAMIDRQRIRKKSAVNQSAGGVAQKHGDITLKRTISFVNQDVIVEDRLTKPASLAIDSLSLGTQDVDGRCWSEIFVIKTRLTPTGAVETAVHSDR